MQFFAQNSRTIALIASVLTIGLYVANFLLLWLDVGHLAWAEIRYELENFAVQAIILLPAFIALFTFRNLPHRAIIGIGYLVYLLPVLYIYTAGWWATDPLQPGLMFLVVGLPIAILLSVLTLLQLKNNLT